MKHSFLKYVLLATLTTMGLLALTGCQSQAVPKTEEPAADSSVKVKVLSTIFPEYDFAKAIGGESVESKLLIPPGTEAHHYEPTPQDLIALKEADVFVYTSEAMEPWIDKMLSQVGPNTVVVEASEGITMLHAEDLGLSGALVEHEEEATAGEEADHDHEGVDPHIWLDPANAQIMATNIKDALVKVNPEHAKLYEKNYEDYASALKELDQAYTDTLKGFENKSIMFAGHFAFGYMAHKWDIGIYSPYEGFSPDAEPSPQKIAEMIDLMKSKQIKTVYYEELIDPKIARVIASESGAELVMLHAAHNVSKDEMTMGINYLTIMRENLEKLKAGFEK